MMSPPPSTCQPSQPQPFPDPIPGIIDFGTLTMLAGAPGVGKTAMLAGWCQRWRAGRTICGHATNPPPGGFYYLAADRSWNSHQLWFDLVGFPDIPHYSLVDAHEFHAERIRKTGARDNFLFCMERLRPQPGSHLIIDPGTPIFIEGNTNDAKDVSTSLLWYQKFARRERINITLVGHFGKQKGDPKEQYARPQDRIAGSGAFSGYSDTQVYLMDAPEASKGAAKWLLGWTPHHAPAEEFAFARDAQGLFVPYDLYAELERIEEVYKCIPETPTSLSVILVRVEQKTGLSSSRTRYYLDQLVSQYRVTKVARGLYARAKVTLQ